jgi:SAM-dependent methyltransferase
VSALNDPALVRREYADETRFAVRAAAWDSAVGPDPKEVAFQAVAEVAPRCVLEAGPGRGELSERITRELGAQVYAVDQSPRMVELTRSRGIATTVGDVQDLPYADGVFDCAVAAWMLYHVPDVDRALRELRRVLRPGGRLVAVTNSERSLPELWAPLGDRAQRRHPFSAENGEWRLLRRFTLVERRDVRGTVTFESWEAARRYVAASTSRAHLADELPYFEGPLRASRHVVVFVCEP